MEITYDEFEAKYKPLPMLETYGADLELVQETDEKYIWTFVDGGDYSGYSAGFHYVNRLGYIICEVPWESEDLYVDLYEPDECEKIGHEFESRERYDGKYYYVCIYCEQDEGDINE